MIWERTDTTLNVKTNAILPADLPARIQQTVGHSEPPVTISIIIKSSLGSNNKYIYNEKHFKE